MATWRVIGSRTVYGCSKGETFEHNYRPEQLVGMEGVFIERVDPEPPVVAPRTPPKPRPFRQDGLSGSGSARRRAGLTSDRGGQ